MKVVFIYQFYEKMNPPLIHFNNQIELFGPKGKEIYYVDKVYFYKCDPIDGKCFHDISIQYISPFLMDEIYFPSKNKKENTLLIHQVSYQNLVSKGYIRHLKKWNQVLITPCQSSSECCQLIKIPMIGKLNE